MKKLFVNTLHLVLGLLGSIAPISEAWAQGAVPGPQTPGLVQTLSGMLPMFVVVFMIFYLLVLKPQQAKIKAQQDLLGGLKKGDSVVTSSGIVGKVASLDTDYLQLEVSPNVKLKVERQHIARREKKDVTA